ncbi:transcription factor mef2A-like [Lucilia sericata]|uniref:transcription factor mef2A-like n=1 Tax=Lucilia sericata TaxID=13632 RepID=UPI0018A83CE6|nr:transcription factor mef2A-like [Lucilia sericata]XP_037817753.1 transcription factor mef2A-like [Lucilia sericata]
MTQHTQPVGAGQHQHQQHQQTSTPQQQQHQTTTTPNTNNNTNNNNNSSTTPTTTNNNQTQTVAVQQQHQQNNNNNNNNNNNYQSQQQQNATGGQIFNPQMPSANGYVPTLGMPAAAAAAAHHHHPQQHHHHQPYQAMMPAAIPSTVYVHNVTANVNLHGWPHTAPHGPWVHPGGGPHYIHGDLPPEQGAPVIQPMGAMPVTLQAPNALGGPVMNPNPNAISGGTRGSRRGRGRGGTSGSRRGDYNMQRHPQPEGSPAPQQGGQIIHKICNKGQQTTDGQQMVTALPPSYVPHPQYAAHAPQYPYAYPTFFAPQQHMIHPGQSAAAQQATGTPLYFSTMPVYNGHQMYNYGYYLPPVMNQSEYQYGEEVGVAGPLGDERQPAGEGGAMMWHQQPMYTDEYGMSPADMHAVSTDDMNHNASSMGSANETPNLLSPNYTPMYEQMTQQMGVMHIYDDPQMGQIQVMHPQPGVPQLEEELSECGSQPSTAPIQMVPAATAAVPPLPMIIEPHYIPVTGGAIMPIDETLTPIATTPQHQQQIQQPALQQQQQQQPSITGGK